jgi:hypothetical protein
MRDVFGFSYSTDYTAVNIILDDVRVLYCGIPKLGTRTFIHELMEKKTLGDNLRVYNASLAKLLALNPSLKDYYSFSFVRNPWARVVSVYKSKICHPNISAVRTYFIRYKDLHYRMPFSDFVEWLCCSEEGRDEFADRHWISQYYFLYSGPNQLVDYIAYFEDLSCEWQSICEKIGVNHFELENYSRKTSSDLKSYRTFYNERTANLVAERYARDIELFGYKF